MVQSHKLHLLKAAQISMFNYIFLCLRKSEDISHHNQQLFVAFNLTLFTYTDKDIKKFYNLRKNYIGMYMQNTSSFFINFLKLTSTMQLLFASA